MTTKKHKEVQVLISYHDNNDIVCNSTFEMSGDELRAMTRHLSKGTIADTELHAVVPMKNLHDTCLGVCKKIMGLD